MTLTADMLKQLERLTRPCVGCGYCCRQAPCTLSVLTFGPDVNQNGCCALTEVEGRYRCGLVLNAADRQRERLVRALAIGAGCCSPLNTDRRCYE